MGTDHAHGTTDGANRRAPCRPDRPSASEHVSPIGALQHPWKQVVWAAITQPDAGVSAEPLCKQDALALGAEADGRFSKQVEASGPNLNLARSSVGHAQPRTGIRYCAVPSDIVDVLGPATPSTRALCPCAVCERVPRCP
jgi:hypothetical protein